MCHSIVIIHSNVRSDGYTHFHIAELSEPSKAYFACTVVLAVAYLFVQNVNVFYAVRYIYMHHVQLIFDVRSIWLLLYFALFGGVVVAHLFVKNVNVFYAVPYMHVLLLVSGISMCL